MPNANLKICFDRILPEDQASHRAAVANFQALAKEHGVTAKTLRTLDANHPVVVARMAIVVSKKWEPGHHLTCRFLDGEADWQAKVIAKAKIWEQHANVKIDFVDTPDAEVRISFMADAGSWSAMGKDCLNATYFPPDQATMNFGWLRGDTDDEEYERVVVHEFGHALGCIHEHQSPTEKLDWDPAAVYAAFGGPPNNWDKASIDSNILQKYSPAGIKDTIFDEKSIMLYQFDDSLFKDHKGTPLNYELSSLDMSMIKKMYP